MALVQSRTLPHFNIPLSPILSSLHAPSSLFRREIRPVTSPLSSSTAGNLPCSPLTRPRKLLCPPPRGKFVREDYLVVRPISRSISPYCLVDFEIFMFVFVLWLPFSYFWEIELVGRKISSSHFCPEAWHGMIYGSSINYSTNTLLNASELRFLNLNLVDVSWDQQVGALLIAGCFFSFAYGLTEEIVSSRTSRTGERR